MVHISQGSSFNGWEIALMTYFSNILVQSRDFFWDRDNFFLKHTLSAKFNLLKFFFPLEN